jgi:hypothetical protein
MGSIVVAPGLTLDEEMYETAKVAVGRYVADKLAEFTWERFVARESWRLIPDLEHPEEPFFKAEMIIKQEPPYTQTIKLNIWRSADLRRDGAPMPHSHPWPFMGHVLMGAYVEDRYEVSRPNRLLVDPHSQWNLGSVSLIAGVVHYAGLPNSIELDTFHEVVDVLEPGRTMSLMDCDLGRKDGWGYLNPDTGLYVPSKWSPLDSRFKARMLELNPHLKK